MVDWMIVALVLAGVWAVAMSVAVILLIGGIDKVRIASQVKTNQRWFECDYGTGETETSQVWDRFEAGEVIVLILNHLDLTVEETPRIDGRLVLRAKGSDGDE